jgi:MOSC domain-containing protein YiiM
MRVLSVQSGGLRTVAGPRGAYETGIDKRPAAGRVVVGIEGIPGDAVANRAHHGGPDQALLLFSAAHYPSLERRLGRALPPGSFGENLTVEGLDERTARLGDVLRAGTAVLEVSSPRLPCATLAHHLRDGGLPEAIRGRAGWYVRVLEAGTVAAGDPLALVSRGDPAWTVERALAIRDDEADLEGSRSLLAVPALSARWRAKMEARLRAAGGRP